MALAAESELPACDKLAAGMLVFTQTEQKFFVCSNLAWLPIDVSGPKGEKGDKGEPGEQGLVGSQGDPGSSTFPSGNVGIGTASPLSQLHLGNDAAGGEATYRGNLIIESKQTNDAVNGLEFKSSNDANGYGYRLATVYDGYAAIDLKFQSRKNSATWTDAMVIAGENGNVGIGASTPPEKLHVDGKVSIGTSGSTRLLLGNLDAPLTSNYAATVARTSGNGTGIFGATEYGNLVLQPMTMNSRSTVFLKSDGGEAMRVHQDGKVGIGAPAPTAALEIKSAAAAADIMTTKSGVGWGGWVQRAFRSHPWGPQLVTHHARGTEGSPQALNAGDYLLNIDVYGHDGTAMADGAGLYFMTANAWTPTSHPSTILMTTIPENSTTAVERLRVAASGNVGIGVSSPQTKLHVGGVARLEPQASAPSSPGLGDIYVHTSAAVCFFNGSAWEQLNVTGACP